MTTKPLNGYTFKNAASLARMARVLNLLEAPHTRSELAAATGIGINAMDRYLSALIDVRPKKIHICDWRSNSHGCPSPVYLVGDKPNKRRPRAMTSAERQRRCRERNPESLVVEQERKRLARTKPRRDAMTAALFGAA